ncbi:MAG: hypothetical protein UY34_C0013G0023 [Parcubacteria group bacterium GW2011_GWA2_48_9]|nr:MAG: hypothetical protein UY34_C0013G0023 [Parcubacteria group bacterium GW2011_GWA2_48_9]
MQLPTEGYILAGLLLAGVWIVSTELGRQFAIWFGEKNCYFLFKRTRPTFLLAYPLTFVARHWWYRSSRRYSTSVCAEASSIARTIVSGNLSVPGPPFRSRTILVI